MSLLLLFNQPAVGGSYTITADSGSFALTGTAAGLVRSYTIAANSGSFALSGTDAGLLYGRVIAAAGGTFSLNGTIAALAYGRTLSAAPGSFTVNGASASLLRSYALSVASGSFNWSGSDAVLTYVIVTVPRFPRKSTLAITTRPVVSPDYRIKKAADSRPSDPITERHEPEADYRTKH